MFNSSIDKFIDKSVDKPIDKSQKMCSNNSEQVSAEFPQVAFIGGSSLRVMGSFGLGLAQIVFSHSYSFFNVFSSFGLMCKNFNP